jgi:hypothetical protein
MAILRSAALLAAMLWTALPGSATALSPVLFGAGPGLISGTGHFRRDDHSTLLVGIRGHCVQTRDRLQGVVAWGKKKLTKEEQVPPNTERGPANARTIHLPV